MMRPLSSFTLPAAEEQMPRRAVRASRAAPRLQQQRMKDARASATISVSRVPH